MVVLRACPRDSCSVRCDRFTAPCVFDGPINGACFRAWVEQQLAPVLRPGDIVVMDNLGSHKSAAVRRIIKAAGARLWFLPPYGRGMGTGTVS